MRLRIALDPSALREAASALRERARSLDAALDAAVGRAAEAGADAARAAAPVDTGELRASIRAERRAPGRWAVVADCAHAAFVEFGTGVVGQGTYPGGAPAGWGYDERRTPEAHDPLDPTAWYYRDPASGAVRRTRGHAAQPFMLPAAEAARAEIARAGREALA